MFHTPLRYSIIVWSETTHFYKGLYRIFRTNANVCDFTKATIFIFVNILYEFSFKMDSKSRLFKATSDSVPTGPAAYKCFS